MTAPVSGRVVADADRRFSAWLIDRLLSLGLYAVAAVVAVVALIRPGHTALGVLLVIVVALATWLAGVLMVGLTGVTPGRSLRGTKVVGVATGEPIGVGAALMRQAIVGLGGYPTAGLGDVALAWTATVDETGQRRAWHDRVAGSVVVDVRDHPADPSAVEPSQPDEVVNLTALRLMPAEAAAPAPPAPAAPAGPAGRAAPAGPAMSPTPSGPPVPARVPPAPVEPDIPATPPVPRATSVAAVAPDAPIGPAPARWRVTFDTGESFVVEGLALVGRGPEPQPGERAAHLVVLPSADMSLSKTHAQFGVVPDGSLVVMDRGSTNGSVVLRAGVAKPLPARQPVTLRDGDRVRFGDREMSVALEA